MEIAKWMVAAVAVYNFGGVFVDAILPFGAKQHLYNPRWPPHAKFHNCQSMVMGICLGLLSLYLLFGEGPPTPRHLYLAAATAGVYFVAMLFAPLFPGTAWTDPEFLPETPLPLGQHPQKLVAIALSVILLTACGLAYTAG